MKFSRKRKLGKATTLRAGSSLNHRPQDTPRRARKRQGNPRSRGRGQGRAGEGCDGANRMGMGQSFGRAASKPSRRGARNRVERRTRTSSTTSTLLKHPTLDRGAEQGHSAIFPKPTSRRQQLKRNRRCSPNLPREGTKWFTISATLNTRLWRLLAECYYMATVATSSSPTWAQQ
jgi:hypothetical protein